MTLAATPLHLTLTLTLSSSTFFLSPFNNRWLPILRHLLTEQPQFFEEFTLIAPSYRGLFEPDDSQFHHQNVQITIDNCVVDVLDVMKHAKIKRIDCLLGWSTGAQVGLTLAAHHPESVGTLCLLNPSTGLTLHTALQPFHPLPTFLQKHVAHIAAVLLNRLKGLIPLPLWHSIKAFCDSFIFHVILTILAFFGGFPPEQPVFFHEYMHDVFKTRSQTRALLDLILSLDAALPPKAFTLTHRTLLICGTPDFMTGVYHTKQLLMTLPHVSSVTFTMGSHFLLIEWPELVARAVKDFLDKSAVDPVDDRPANKRSTTSKKTR